MLPTARKNGYELATLKAFDDSVFYLFLFFPAFTASDIAEDEKTCSKILRRGEVESTLKGIDLVKKPRLVNTKESGDTFVLDSRLVGPENLKLHIDGGQYKFASNYWIFAYARDPNCKKQNSNLTMCFGQVNANNYEKGPEIEYIKKKCGKFHGFLSLTMELLLKLTKQIMGKRFPNGIALGVSRIFFFLAAWMNPNELRNDMDMQVHGGGPDCCPLNLTLSQVQEPYSADFSKCHFAWKTVKMCVTQQQEAQLCDYTYKVGYAPKITDKLKE
uniref:Uncharacterized protein n=1 Tax=Ditylenchus dipsaci TaxID=166011 RepID=A0A915DFI7_9BILA